MVINKISIQRILMNIEYNKNLRTHKSTCIFILYHFVSFDQISRIIHEPWKETLVISDN